VLSLLIVLKLRVKDRGDEGRGGPAADSGSGIVLGLVLAMEQVWGAATNGRATLDQGTLVARSDIFTQWSKIARLLPLS